MQKKTGSAINQEITSTGATKLWWSNKSKSILTWLMVPFLVLWLSVWGVGLFFVITDMLQQAQDEARLIIYFWFAGAVFVGAIATLTLLRIVQPKKPESIILHADGFDYDSGTKSPLDLHQKHSGSGFAKNMGLIKALFQPRTQISGVKRSEAGFVLDRNPSRLYFDYGTKRIVVGEMLSEPEVEKLYEQLAKWENR